MSYQDRWIFVQTNLGVDQNVTNLIFLIGRSRDSGYTGLVLVDYKFSILEQMPQHYFDNVAQVKQAADFSGIEIIPELFPFAGGSGLLAHDHNLAEGFPVMNAPFIAYGGQATLIPSVAMVNGGLEVTNGNIFPGYFLQEGSPDTATVHSGQVSCRMQPVNGMARLAQLAFVRPHACYKFSCWVKTESLVPASSFKLAVVSAMTGRSLAYFTSPITSTQDWTYVDVVFNSLDETEIRVYAGLWGVLSGLVWVDDLALEEVAFVNILRRWGCPLTVADEDMMAGYVEGKDFAYLVDPLLGGTDPSAATYDFHHAGPTLKLVPGSRIKDGDRLRVSWYHPVIIWGKVNPCVSEPKLYGLLEDQAKRINDLFHPKTFFMGHSEIREIGWCQACQIKGGPTAGSALSANVGNCVQMLRKINPTCRIVVWSDMFDPGHNATAQYYLAKGTLDGSWKGLQANVNIANWKDGIWTIDQATASLQWFSSLSHQQVIAGYYDQGMANIQKWQAAGSATGFMYTTWQNNYSDLEAYGAILTS